MKINLGLIAILTLMVYIGNFVVQEILQKNHGFGVENIFMAFGLLALSMFLSGQPSLKVGSEAK